MSIVVRVLLILAGMAVGSLLGLFLGALVGGNWAADFELFGLRGYEAAGKLGLYLGLPAGGFAAALLTSRRRSGSGRFRSETPR